MVRVAATQPGAVPTAYRWSRDRYERLVELGLLDDQRVELIGGQIVQMAPKGPRHTGNTALVKRVLEAAFPADRAYVRKEDPLALGAWDEPEPDLAVVVGDFRQYTAAHPTASQTLLVIEIADTTADYDQGPKADIYAAAGITDYWVVLPGERAVAVLREPAPDPASDTGMRYRARRTYRVGDVIVPLAAPDRPIAVADLLL